MFPNLLVQQQFEKMLQTGQLYVVNVSGKDLWDLYLNSFKELKVFRDPNSNEHNCNCCRNIGSIDTPIQQRFKIIKSFRYLILKQTKNMLLLLKQYEMLFIIALFVIFLQKILLFVLKKKVENFIFLVLPKNIKIYTKEEADKFGVVRPNIAYTFEHYFLRCPKKYINKKC